MCSWIFLFGVVVCVTSGCQGSLATEKVDVQVGKPLVPIVYSPKYKISVFGLERLPSYDIGKYDKIYAALKKDGLVSDKTVVTPRQVTEKEMLRVHTSGYLKRLKKTAYVARYLEAPSLKIIPNRMVDGMVVSRFRLAAAGTLAAARLALKNKSKLAINLGGGLHHAKPDSGEGFCIIADVPIAIRTLQAEGLIKKALIIDTDIHQGNGTIVCLKNDPTTFTFSMHEGGIYPMPKEVGDKDIELQAGVTDAEYLKILKKALNDVFQRTKPDIVFHVAGCDALTADPLANARMTIAGIAKRDMMVVEACQKHGVPYVMTLAGGYSKDAWKAQYQSIKSIIEVAQKKK